ncbi:MAG: hypothetical protein AAFN92_06915, partial [Bacteroidota bacterium]
MPENTDTTPMYREAAIQDMLGKPPGWLLHSGISAIALVFTVVLGLTALIRYPDKVEAPFLLQTRTVPLALHAGAGQVIDTVYTPGGVAVSTGDTLLVLRSEGSWQSVRALARWLADQSAREPGALGQLRVPFADTGNFPVAIQQPLTTLVTVLNARISYLRTSGVAEEVAAYEREIADAGRLSKSLNRQVDLYDKELGYQEKQTDRLNGLAADGIVSTQEAEQAAAQSISAQRQREVLVSSDIQNQLRVQQLRQQILQRRLAHREQLADFDRQAAAQLKLLRTALEDYRNRYVVVAREAGTIHWQPSVRAQATVAGTTSLGYLMPEGGAEEIVARLELPASGQGKITVGDRVLLDFAAYPSREYGQVAGTLTAVDPVALSPDGKEYFRQATVSLPNLTTSYGDTLTFRYNLSGTANI